MEERGITAQYSHAHLISLPECGKCGSEWSIGLPHLFYKERLAGKRGETEHVTMGEEGQLVL